MRITQLLIFTLLTAAGSNVYADSPRTDLAMGKAPQRVALREATTVTAVKEPVEAVNPVVTNPVVTNSVSTNPVINDGPVVVAPREISEEPCIVPNPAGYAIGVADVLTINVVRPEPLLMESTVSPDGTISFPYIGTVVVKGKTLDDVQNEMTKKLGEGYMKYPVLSVTLKESNSRRFFVYGEVSHPGPYAVEENMTVLRAISMAGGFSKFGSSSRVKVLRPRNQGRGYDPVKINIKEVMEGQVDSDMIIKPGDIVVVSEGVF
jgi:protein involved in polysaccharide export with SLBB domain